ncbi:TIGR03016 family PEP-CTERM system-associated outer membrane protein [Chitinivorax sp. B]|uniref:TIGR03016 family PEP-CTERM system-associated outer membrane protein n=1 Tax=Chitinivorax sp. B TaxID=2502235 RepID=UPI0010FA2CED|nr:TIGR03016 family PEP-CTERM system-associated outer membrane protein [Chitinivorax sp. B]
MSVKSGRWQPCILSFLISTLFPAIANGAAWDVEMRVPTSIGYTDNADLAGSSGERKDDWFLRVQPGFSARAIGSRLKLNTNYAYSHERHQNDRQGKSGNHQLSSNASLELIDNWLTLNGTAAISQIARDSTSAVGITNSNKDDIRSWSLGPYVHQRFGNALTMDASVVRNGVRSSGRNARATDGDGTRADLTVVSGLGFNNVNWAFSLQDNRFDYISRSDTHDKRGSVRTTLTMSPMLQPYVTWGYEKLKDDLLQSKPSSKYWNAGAIWLPTARTTLDANIGRRYFGNTSSVSFSHRTRASTWRISYVKDLTTSNQDFLIPQVIDTRAFLDSQFKSRYPNDAERAARVNAFMRLNGLGDRAEVEVPFSTNRRFLDRNLNVSVGLRVSRSDLLLSYQWRDSDAGKVSLPGEGIQDIGEHRRTQTASFTWGLPVGKRTSLSLGTIWSRNQFIDNGLDDRTLTYRAGLNYQIARDLIGAAEVRRTQRDANDDVRDYTENAGLLTVTALF